MTPKADPVTSYLYLCWKKVYILRFFFFVAIAVNAVNVTYYIWDAILCGWRY